MDIERKIKFESPRYWEIVAVFGHSNEGNPDLERLTLDGEIRVRAAGILYQVKKSKKHFLLGGGNDEIARQTETKKMARYLQENFSVPIQAIQENYHGTNTLENIANLLEEAKLRKLDLTKIAFVTSNYNRVRLALLAEILGWQPTFIFSAEDILLESNDKLSSLVQKYLLSKEYQKRISYEVYWLARTIFDDAYTQTIREKLLVQAIPIKYFQNLSARKMENIEE